MLVQSALCYFLEWCNSFMTDSNNFSIVTDSSADFSQEMCEKFGVDVVPLTVQICGKTYRDYPDERDITRKEFYKLLRKNEMGKTSAPNVSDFYEIFEKILDSKRDVLYIAFSSGMSATYSNAKVAAEQLKPFYPDSRILICDSLCASLGQGFLVHLAAKKRELGYSLSETYDFVEKEKLRICHWFTVEDLHHLQRGGRISKFVAVAGSLLNIKPILRVDDNGKLVKMYSARGRRSSVKELFNNFRKFAVIEENHTIFISHGDCAEDANTLKKFIKGEFKVDNVYVNMVGPVIGIHSGPGTLALFFLGNGR